MREGNQWVSGQEGRAGRKASRTEQPDSVQLRALPLFATLSERAIDEVIHLSSWRRYDKEAQITPPAPTHDLAYSVVDGEVQISRLSREGRRFIQSRVRRGGFFELGSGRGGDGDEVVAEATVGGTIVCSLP
mgnify:CR=1 FL=1